MFKKLLEPIKIGNFEIKNRMSTAAMEMLLCTPDGKATDRYINYVEARAKGGFGLIINEATAILKGVGAFYNCSGAWSDDQIEGHTRVAAAAHKHGAKIGVQIIHCGRQAEVAVTKRPLEAPTPLRDPDLTDTPEELTLEKIQMIINAYGDAALRVKKAGYDFVELHGAHGYLLMAFLSPFSNKRTDEYGGSFHNRARFTLEVIKNVREKCGADFPIIFRMSTTEYLSDGLDISQTRAYARMLEEAGVAAINTSCANNATVHLMYPPHGTTAGPTSDLSEEIKRVVKIPVLNVGRYTDPYIADTMLEAGKADIIAFARQSLADPDFPNKVMSGEIEDIRNCIGCVQGCLGRKGYGGLYGQCSPSCMVNPTLGYEGEYDFSAAEKQKKIMVVGGGVAGMYAAYAAAKRGHTVTIYEKGDRLGGQWNLAAMPPHKQELTTVVVWLKRQLKKLGVTVKLNSTVDKDMVAKAKVDKVIVATGATPIKPKIPGIDSDCVSYANEVLSCKKQTGSKVVVIGGGQVGAEVAAFLAGLHNDVTIIEMLDCLCNGGMPITNAELTDYLKEYDVKEVTGATVKEITNNYVIYTKGNQTFTVDGISDVVIAVGSTSNNGLTDELKGVVDVAVVGDAANVADALRAIQAGFKAGYEA